jgi:hypothetical protein
MDIAQERGGRAPIYGAAVSAPRSSIVVPSLTTSSRTARSRLKSRHRGQSAGRDEEPVAGGLASRGNSRAINFMNISHNKYARRGENRWPLLPADTYAVSGTLRWQLSGSNDDPGSGPTGPRRLPLPSRAFLHAEYRHNAEAPSRATDR